MPATRRVLIADDLTIAHIPRQKARLLGVLRDSRTMLLDLSAVHEIDSVGLQMLIEVKRAARRQGKCVSVVACNAALGDLVELSGRTATSAFQALSGRSVMGKELTAFVGQSRRLLTDFASRALQQSAAGNGSTDGIAMAKRQFVDDFMLAITTLVDTQPIDSALAGLLLECCVQTRRLAATNVVQIAQSEALASRFKAIIARQSGTVRFHDADQGVELVP